MQPARVHLAWWCILYNSSCSLLTNSPSPIYIFDLGYGLHFCSVALVSRLIPEWNQLWSCYILHLCILLRSCLWLTYIWSRSWFTFYQSHWFLDSHSRIEPVSWDWIGPNNHNNDCLFWGLCFLTNHSAFIPCWVLSSCPSQRIYV